MSPPVPFKVRFSEKVSCYNQEVKPPYQKLFFLGTFAHCWEELFYTFEGNCCLFQKENSFCHRCLNMLSGFYNAAILYHLQLFSKESAVYFDSVILHFSIAVYFKPFLLILDNFLSTNKLRTLNLPKRIESSAFIYNCGTYAFTPFYIYRAFFQTMKYIFAKYCRRKDINRFCLSKYRFHLFRN